MQILLQNISKRYRYDLIFKHIQYNIPAYTTHAILGKNGSGKSTLLQIIAGNLQATKGTIHYTLPEKPNPIPIPQLFVYVSIATPYLQLIEELTLSEILTFQEKFKPFLPNITPDFILDYLQLLPHKNKPIQHFSSGMKQRLKLALAVFANTPLVLLDEPTTHLDTQGIQWYTNLITQYCTQNQQRTLIIASNQAHEYEFCTHNFLNINNFK